MKWSFVRMAILFFTPQSLCNTKKIQEFNNQIGDSDALNCKPFTNEICDVVKPDMVAIYFDINCIHPVFLQPWIKTGSVIPASLKHRN